MRAQSAVPTIMALRPSAETTVVRPVNSPDQGLNGADADRRAYFDAIDQSKLVDLIAEEPDTIFNNDRRA